MPVHRNDFLYDCGRFNDKVSDQLSKLGADMRFFWFCVALDILALPGLALVIMQTLGANLPRTAVYLSVLVTIVSFISQTVIQLLMLPVLQNSGARHELKSDALAESTYHNSLAVENQLNRIEAHLGISAPTVAVPTDIEATD